MVFQINTYWNVETLYYVFNFVSAFMGSNTWSAIMKLVFFFSIAIGMFMYMGKKQLEFFGWFIQALIFSTLLNLPIATVILADKSNLEAPRTVGNVPLMMAISAHTVNLISGSLADAYETGMGIPSELGLAKGDVGFGHKILKNVNKAQISDPALRADLMQFFKECTLYDIADGAISTIQLQKQSNVWDTILNAANTNGARFVTIGLMTNTPPVTTTCTVAAPLLKARVNAGLLAAKQEFGSKIFTRASTDAIALGMLNDAAGVAYSTLLGSSQSASDAMKQAMFNNMWKDAGVELPALMNDPTRIAEMAALQGAAGGARQQEISNRSMTILAEESIPNLRNWIEAILYALFPVMVVMTIVSSLEGARKVIGGYLGALAWIGLWPLLFAVINHLSMMALQRKLNGLKLSTEGVTFSASDVFNATLIDEQSSIAYLILSVPFIAGAIIKMGSGQIMGLADKLIPEQSAGAGQMSGGLASGNLSMGNASVDSHNANSTSMNKINSSHDSDVGRSSTYMASGAKLTTSANGSQIYQSAVTKLPFAVREEASNSSNLAQNAAHNVTSSTGTQLVGSTDASQGLKISQRVASSLDGYTDKGKSLTKTESGGVHHNAGTNTSVANASATGGAGGLTANASDTLSYGFNGNAGVQTPGSGGGGSGGGKGGGAAGSRAPLQLGIGVRGGADSAFVYNANVSKTGSTDNRAVVSGQHGTTYTGGTNEALNDTGTKGLRYVENKTRDATTDQSNSKAIRETRDAGTNTSNSAGLTAGINKNKSVSSSTDLTQNPEALSAILAKEKIGIHEFDGMSASKKQALFEQYAATREMSSQVNTMPSKMIDGAVVKSAADIRNEHLTNRATLESKQVADMNKTGKEQRAATAATSEIKAPAVNLNLGVTYKETQNAIDYRTGLNNANTAKLQEEAKAKASMDRRLGGEATALKREQQAQGTTNAINDFKAEAGAAWNKLTSPNPKNANNPPVPLNDGM